jgi:hypothetical protein
MTNLTIGKTYYVIHSRKGAFSGKALKVDDEWTTLLITHGNADAMVPHNARSTGEEVTIRRSMASFTEAP